MRKKTSSPPEIMFGCNAHGPSPADGAMTPLVLVFRSGHLSKGRIDFRSAYSPIWPVHVEVSLDGQGWRYMPASLRLDYQLMAGN